MERPARQASLCSHTAKVGDNMQCFASSALTEEGGCFGLLFLTKLAPLLSLLLLRGGQCGVQVWRPPQELIDSYSSGIEQVLQYQFKKRGLLQEALTHTSWPDATQQASPLPHPLCPPPPARRVSTHPSSGHSQVLCTNPTNVCLIVSCRNMNDAQECCAVMQGYQRLEFLGDAVLDLLMTRYYFITYRSVHPCSRLYPK